MPSKKFQSNTHLSFKDHNKFNKHKKSCISEYFRGENLVDLFGADDTIGMQGELYRFKPGMDKNFI